MALPFLPALLALVSALAGLTAACGRPSRAETLKDSVRGYHEGLRWRRYEQAATFIPAPAREVFLDAQEQIGDDLRISDYEVERVRAVEDKAAVQVRMTWHLDSVGTVHETVLDEEWRRDGKIWTVVRVSHKRGEKLPDLGTAP